jgi:hypothetical protein
VTTHLNSRLYALRATPKEISSAKREFTKLVRSGVILDTNKLVRGPNSGKE